MTLMEAVSDRLKRLKKEKKFTSYKIQKEGGVPRSTVGKLVSMKFNTVQLDTIYQIALRRNQCFSQRKRNYKS